MAMKKMTEGLGQELVKKIVSDWSKIYINQVFYLETRVNVWQYEVEFSMPKNKTPIPAATVKIYFSIIDTEQVDDTDGADNERFEYEFNFENESLIHKLNDQTMRTNMFESWINNLIEKKFKIGSQLHLGTEFEHTR